MKKILVIDDDKDILEPISIILEIAGYQVFTSVKGDEAYNIVDKFRPDIILLDILMSGSDGRIICKRLKQDDSTKNIPIIMMSAHPAAKFDSTNSGAEGFIAKPFDTNILLSIIQEHLPE